MKSIYQIIIFLSLALSVSAQCAFEHEGNYTAYKLGWSSYGSSITANDSITFTLYNFFGTPGNVFNDTIVGKLNCTNDSVHFIPISFNYGWYGFDFSGIGVFNQDTLIADYTYIIYDQYGPHISYPHIVYKLIPVGVESEYSSERFQIFPNPAINIVNIHLKCSEETKEIRIYNVLGKVVLMLKGTDLIDISSFAHGSYSITILTSKNNIYITKFFKLYNNT